ncbi:MAG: serine hydrolase [Gemmatimonadota bacterium]|nr:MAG: serine hydrolase [Gemmatimonadota bacterium]
MRKILAVLVLVLLAAAGVGVANGAAQAPQRTEVQSSAATAEDLDAFISGVVTESGLPGLAIAVVKDGEVILSKGYGYRDLDGQLPVTSSTLFAIGSITKSFTVTVLGMLADEGKLDWDVPVRTYLPDFRLQDDVAGERMTPRDLVTHRSGLPRHDLLWYGSDLTRREMYERLRYLEPSKDFRQVFQYQNLMFMTAGYLAGQIAGTGWEELVRERVFQPLGMLRSNFSVHDSQKSDDFAYPYVRLGDEVRQVDFRNLDEIGPAGSINSSVEEMIRYVQLHIEKGKHGGEQLLSQSNAEQMQTPQMAIQGAIQYEELGHSAYGMGLVVSSYRGKKVVSHGGGIDGFIAQLSFMPREQLGMIILTNQSGENLVPAIVERGVYDRVLGLEPLDWAARIRERLARAEEAEKKAEEEALSQRRDGTSPSHDLSEYVGTYEHAAYGVVTISLEADTLRAVYRNEKAPLIHFHYDVFTVPEDPLIAWGDTKVQFLYDKKGVVDRLSVPLEPAVADIVFTRVAD